MAQVKLTYAGGKGTEILEFSKEKSLLGRDFPNKLVYTGNSKQEEELVQLIYSAFYRRNQMVLEENDYRASKLKTRLLDLFKEPEYKGIYSSLKKILEGSSSSDINNSGIKNECPPESENLREVYYDGLLKKVKDSESALDYDSFRQKVRAGSGSNIRELVRKMKSRPGGEGLTIFKFNESGFNSPKYTTSDLVGPEFPSRFVVDMSDPRQVNDFARLIYSSFYSRNKEVLDKGGQEALTLKKVLGHRIDASAYGELRRALKKVAESDEYRGQG
jgi:hypothetical protein